MAARRFGSAFWEKQMETASFFMKALGAIYLIREHVVEFRACVGPSMLPTLNSRGDILLVDQTAPTFDRIAVGDVVIARSVQNPRHTVCKRVLGLEGDEVDVHPPNRPGSTHKITVPKGHVWLQGDNFYNSQDSRHYGPVPYAVLRGKVLFKVWPLWEAGPVESRRPDAPPRAPR